MLSRKKGEGLSLTTLIVAIIVIVVLFILVGITTGYFGKWTKLFGGASDVECKGIPRDARTGCQGAEVEDIAAQTSAGKVCCVNPTAKQQQGVGTSDPIVG